ncbi:MAG: hypothetical protein JO013_02340 [Alphaproteobacteria bacterium]|nr:hypothetical protein [Alphaproteobacteria bacterium]
MTDYRAVGTLMPAAGADGLDPAVWRPVVSCLAGIWLDDYGRRGADAVEVSSAHFSYLFDLEAERLISAWGISRGRQGGERDKARMKGHPLGAGPLYHRGHAIPHTLGGAMDINLVPQRGSVNTGPFRHLEKEAVATPGALYFTYWQYAPERVTARRASQVPAFVDQGLLIPGETPKIRRHAN